MRNRLKTPLPLKDILQDAMRQPVLGPSLGAPARPKGDEVIDALLGRWSDMVGAALAAKSRPVRLLGRRLLVEVDSSAWANELEFRRVSLLEKLAALFAPTGRAPIEGIRFRLKSVTGERFDRRSLRG